MTDDTEVDFAALAERAVTMRRRIARARDDLLKVQADGIGGGGLVRATVNGENRVIAVDIDPSVIDPDDPETLGALICEAVNDAVGKLTAGRAERMAGIAEGFTALLDDAPGETHRVRPMTADRRLAPYGTDPTQRR